MSELVIYSQKEFSEIDTAGLIFNPENSYICKTPIPGLLIIKRPYWGDQRGGFKENWRIPDILNQSWIESTFSQSSDSDMCVGTRKGFHCELQDKLITFRAGEFFVVELDVRPDSLYFGNYLIIKLNINTSTNSSRDRISLVIPKGVGNSMQIIQPRKNDTFADITYLTSTVYNPAEAQKKVIRMDDPQLNIKWPETDNLTVSDRDRQGNTLETFIEKYGSEYTSLFRFK